MTLEELAENQSKLFVKVQDDLAHIRAILEMLFNAEIERVKDKIDSNDNEIHKLSLEEIMNQYEQGVESRYQDYKKKIEVFLP